MFNTIAMNTLGAIKGVPVLVGKFFAVKTSSCVWVAHLGVNGIGTHLHFVILLEVFNHPVISEDAFPRTHNAVLKRKILDCENTTKQNYDSKPFRAEVERLMNTFDILLPL